MISLPSLFSVTILSCLQSSLSVSINANQPRNSVCQRIPFYGSPAKTMHPRKGEILVQRGHTLDQEATRNHVLRQHMDYARRSQVYRSKVIPYAMEMGLDAQESMAIFVYTLGGFAPPLYAKFNEAMRKGEDHSFATFHFFLDSGLKKLLKKQGSHQGYHYRGLSVYFTFTDNTTTFPGFTSTSRDFTVAREGFWSEGCTMMKISTHLGADITRMSNFTKEKEVLIPPYEVFTVKGYTQENGMPTVTLETQEPVIIGTYNSAGITWASVHMVLTAVIVSATARI